eukprot:PhF_6_TR42900/c0_g1_i1/m.65002
MVTIVRPGGQRCCLCVTLINLLFLYVYYSRQSTMSLKFVVEKENPGGNIRFHSNELSPIPNTRNRSDTPRRRTLPSSSSTSSSQYLAPNLLIEFSKNGTIPVMYSYKTSQSVNAVPVYTKDNLNALYSAVVRGDNVLFEYEHYFVEAVRDHKYIFHGKSVLILGSDVPVIEVVVTALGGAKSITVVDYQPKRIEESRFRTYTVEEFWKSNNGTQYDVVVSFSSFQHDGLGAYGDAVDPNGDTKAMDEAWSLIRPGGYLLFAVPYGNDCVMYPSHKTYGRRTYTSLIVGWLVLQSYGFQEQQWYDSTCNGHKNAILVLQRIMPSDQALEFGKIPGLLGPLPHYVHAIPK